MINDNLFNADIATIIKGFEPETDIQREYRTVGGLYDTWFLTQPEHPINKMIEDLK